MDDKNKILNPDLVIYHGGCADGTAAAWVFWKHARNTDSKIPEFYGAKHGDPPISNEKILNKTVIMVDFAYKREITEKILQLTKKLVILDHHRSNETELEGLSCTVFDMTRAGCQLAWDYVFPLSIFRPRFLDIIADRDLWNWELPKSKELNKAFYMKKLTESIESIEKLFNMDIDLLYAEGKSFSEYENQLLEKLSRFKTTYYFGNEPKNPTKFYKILVSEAVFMISELGNKISEENTDHDFVILYRFDNYKKAWYFSARARQNSDIDLGSILSLYGGGGHPKAAGFEIKSPTWPADIFLLTPTLETIKSQID